MKLGKKQELFAELLPDLLARANIHAKMLGGGVRVGDLFRDPRVHGAYGVKKAYGARYSMHKLKLAVDINIVIGKRLATSEEHQALGLWWEGQHKLCRWGGMGDGNHYSLSHDDRW